MPDLKNGARVKRGDGFYTVYANKRIEGSGDQIVLLGDPHSFESWEWKRADECEEVEAIAPVTWEQISQKLDDFIYGADLATFQHTEALGCSIAFAKKAWMFLAEPDMLEICQALQRYRHQLEQEAVNEKSS